MNADQPTAPFVTEIDDGPHDLEFFFDPGCPFAWQTSVWLRRVCELKDVKVGWRFISLRNINRNTDLPDSIVDAQELALRYLRVCAAARAAHGNAAVGRLYQAWGERYWYRRADGELVERLAQSSEHVDIATILSDLELPATLAKAADDTSWDPVIQAESDEALRRTGPDVGTPIITYDPPHGNSLFGPVISAVPDDDEAVAFYDALRVFVDFRGFSELKRTDREPLDLPLLAS